MMRRGGIGLQPNAQTSALRLPSLPYCAERASRGAHVRDRTKRRQSAARLAFDLHELAVELARRFNEGDIQEIERELTQAQKSGEVRTYLARLWRIDRFAQFKDRQLRKREWINFREIVDWCSELGGSAERDEARRVNAYKWLQDDWFDGDFEDTAGKSRVLYLFHRVSRIRMTRDQLLNILRTHPTEIARSDFFDRCWLERPMFQRWLAKHQLPLRPSRFEPREGETIIEPPSQQFEPSGETKIEPAPQFEPSGAETAIETPQRRISGRKPYPREAVRAYIDKLYPEGVPANVTYKKIANDFERSERGFHVSPRTVSRATGWQSRRPDWTE